MRDARINTIGEGANEVLKAFIAVVGMRGRRRGPARRSRGDEESAQGVLALWAFSRSQLGARFTTPAVPVQSSSLSGEAATLADWCATSAS